MLASEPEVGVQTGIGVCWLVNRVVVQVSWTELSCTELSCTEPSTIEDECTDESCSELSIVDVWVSVELLSTALVLPVPWMSVMV